jgi:hypothetical protein
MPLIAQPNRHAARLEHVICREHLFGRQDIIVSQGGRHIEKTLSRL